MIFIVVKLLDPIPWLIIGLTVWRASSFKIWTLSVLLAAIVSETMLTATQITRDWGDGFIPALIANAVILLFCVGIKRLIQRIRKK